MMIGWMDGQTDGGTDKWMDRQKNRLSDKWMDRFDWYKHVCYQSTIFFVSPGISANSSADL